MTISMTKHLYVNLRAFQLVTNRKRRRQMPQTLAAVENEPAPEDNDVFSDSDNK